MYKYQKKLILTGNFAEIIEYENPVFKGLNSPCQVGNNATFTGESQKRKDNAIQSQTKLRRLINSNPDLIKFLTLTFAENLTDIKEANKKFKLFRQRLEYSTAEKLKYIVVPEFQKRGAVHYHMLSDLPYIDKEEIKNLWSFGFIKINRLAKVDNIGAYVSKYLTKETQGKIGMKKFFHSNNLKEPQEITDEKSIDLLYNSDIFKRAEIVYQNVIENTFYGTISYQQYNLNNPK